VPMELRSREMIQDKTENTAFVIIPR
jgi:hypothetical protein